jgi:hypothetical protein
VKKIMHFLFFGSLAKHIAGERPLTDRERRGLLWMIYSLSIGYTYYWWKDFSRQMQDIQGEIDHVLYDEDYNHPTIAEGTTPADYELPNKQPDVPYLG